ncbi:MAG: lmo0937 family membrane protein [Pyrinomonadaceae bacterium]
MIWTIVIVLLVLWLLGFIIDVAGGFIHLLLIGALVVLAYNLFAEVAVRHSRGFASQRSSMMRKKSRNPREPLKLP